MAIQTSNYRKFAKRVSQGKASWQQAVGISSSAPQGYLYGRYFKLNPSWSLINGWKDGTIDEQEYETRYTESVLSHLTPRTCLAELIEIGGPDAVLLCWCPPYTFCHRRLVARWLRVATGYEVKEMK